MANCVGVRGAIREKEPLERTCSLTRNLDSVSNYVLERKKPETFGNTDELTIGEKETCRYLRNCGKSPRIKAASCLLIKL